MGIPVVIDTRLAAFSHALAAAGFEGDLETGLGAREVASTDNSIYHVRPLAIAYPRSAADLNRIVRAAGTDPANPLPLCPRGGNTGTNGQSLSAGIVVDFARYMNRILALDVDRHGGTVTVEPGVVLDQLNDALAAHGLFFPPMVSTASRATIGGMVGTDASGKGSRRYGKTSDYVERIDLVTADGDDWAARPMPLAEARAIGEGSGRIAEIHREAIRVALENADEIARIFPRMNRGLTGYNLQKLYDPANDRFFLAPLLAGSEGTLAITKAVTLRVSPKPRHRALAVIRYSSFDGGLRDVQRLIETDPVAIEIIDDNVMDVARSDIIWNDIADVLGEVPDVPVRAISFVEFAGDEAAVLRGLDLFAEASTHPPAAHIDWKIVREPHLIGKLWALREKSVGLLARRGGGRQGTPFVEDTAVPPERLADYVAGFRDLLDGYGLHYGMFGHADVGCLHVRPFMDLKDPAQAALIRPISDAVAALTKAHGGLLWGEHGRGFRGEYSPFFFGPVLFAELGRLKRAFDPANILNPGKLASARPDVAIDRIDTVPFRASLDRQIAPQLRDGFDRAVACNGNGACFSWDARDAMCPSYKATRDRAQSPKGRAALLRTWAREIERPDSAAFREIERATAESLSTCLSCKACTTLCPVKVDVPTMKSRFNERYYARRRRPVRHHCLARLEQLLDIGRAAPALMNLIAQSSPVRLMVERAVGLVDIPRFMPARRRRLAPRASLAELESLSDEDRARSIVLLEDSFTASFDGRVIEDATAVLGALGYSVYRLPARHNGKALHVLGLRQAFAKIARRRVAEVDRLARSGVAIVALDYATALMFGQEYGEFAPSATRVTGIEAVLARDIAAGRIGAAAAASGDRTFTLLTHCTEQALKSESVSDWTVVFRHFGLSVAAARTGCCGMAGLFGHEREHQAISRDLFELSWRPALAGAENTLATGFSCRCQTKRLADFRPRHPIEALRAHLVSAQAGPG